MPSPVLALTLTRRARAPSAAASARGSRRGAGASFGRSMTTRAVDVDDRRSRASREHRDDLAQQLDRVGVAPALVGVGEVLADVAEAGGAEQRVDHRVGEHVGVGVPVEAALVRDLDAAEHQPAARRRGGASRSRCRRARSRAGSSRRSAPGAARGARTRQARRRRARRAAPARWS